MILSDLISEKRNSLEKLAGLLLEREVVGADDLVNILGERPT